MQQAGSVHKLKLTLSLQIKTRPAVMALFKKHNIPYVSKSLWRAFADIVSSLRTYGSAWGDAYYHN